MVNKQYTIRQPHNDHTPSSSTNKFQLGKRCSPPPVRSISLISDAPNPQQAVAQNGLPSHLDDNGNDVAEVKHLTTFGRNISMFGDPPRPAERKSLKTSLESGFEEESKGDYWLGQGRYEFKDLTINDIGRFQYILQMDREMGTHPDSLHRIPSRLPSPASTSSTLNSSNYLKFWKSGSETPITETLSSSRQRRQTKFYKYLKDFWKFTKWPLILLLSCIFLGVLIFFITQEGNSATQYVKEERTGSPDLIHHHNRVEDVDSLTTTNNNNNNNNSILKIFMRNPNVVASTTEDEDTDDDVAVPTHPTTVVFRNTQKLKLIPKKIPWNDEDIFEDTKKSSTPKAIDALQSIGFTSGHQNNFGVPIEEDERVLRMLNEELQRHQLVEASKTSGQPTTTDYTTIRFNVSPTLPSLNLDTSTKTLASNVTDVSSCESTSLAICKGILQYDLTMPGLKQRLTQLHVQHFQYLFDSTCSPRAMEFVCSILEPECRPKLMGVLQPCKRICKSILEPCASIIASSEILTSMFDCDRYPDSSDRNVCEDPTRRKECHDNEYKCLDSTCIPKQWVCDNIKDCSLGEDEDECFACESDEFRCHSNDKCIRDEYRCDQFDDCPDGSDERDCDDLDYDYPSPRIYAFGSIQSPDSPNGHSYATISDEILPGGDEEDRTDPTVFTPAIAENPDTVIDNQTNNETNDEEIQKGAASGRVLIGVSKIIANFQDSKEIMMTSDSETDYKYSTGNGTNSTTPVSILTTSESTATYQTIQLCPDNQLRCVSGKCITVEQLCDKIIDCPDEADEAKCVYKEANLTLAATTSTKKT